MKGAGDGSILRKIVAYPAPAGELMEGDGHMSPPTSLFPTSNAAGRRYTINNAGKLSLLRVSAGLTSSEAAGTKDPGYASMVIIATLVTLLTAF